MPFPSPPVTVLDELQHDIACFVDHWSEEFYQSINDVITLGEQRIWRDVYGAVGFNKSMVGNFSQGVDLQPIYPPDHYTIINSIQIVTPGHESYLLPKDESFLAEVNRDVVEGVPRYYCPTTSDAEELRIMVAPIPVENYQFIIDYRTMQSLVSSPNGTWLSENGSDILFQAALISAYGFLKYDKVRVVEAEEIYTELFSNFAEQHLKDMKNGYFKKAVR